MAIIPFKQDGKPFTQRLRSQTFNHYFNRAQPGDWWAKVDADEFFIENPGGPGSTNIEGFATDISVNRGQTVNFKVNEDSTNRRIKIYRFGYYSEIGRRRFCFTHLATGRSLGLNQLTLESESLKAAGNRIECENFAASELADNKLMTEASEVARSKS